MSIPAFYFQILRVSWDKRARGAPLARLRAALPSKIEPPLGPIISPRWICDRFEWHSADDFQTPRHFQSQHEASAPFRWNELEFDGENGWIWLDAETFGAPKFQFFTPRGVFKRQRFLIPPQGWFQARWNGRFVDFDKGNWWYEQVTFNASFVRPGESLLNGEPTRTFSRLALLR